MSEMLTSKPMVYAPCRSSDVETSSPSPVRSRAHRAALTMAAAVIADRVVAHAAALERKRPARRGRARLANPERAH